MFKCKRCGKDISEAMYSMGKLCDKCFAAAVDALCARIREAAANEERGEEPVGTLERVYMEGMLALGARPIDVASDVIDNAPETDEDDQ